MSIAATEDYSGMIARPEVARRLAETGELPDILIQDPVRQCAYLLPAAEMERYRAGADTWARIGVDTVTFVIPSDDFVAEVPPFDQSHDGKPSVLVQHPRGEAAYFLTHEQLQRYRTAIPEEKGTGYGISFILPNGLELVEEVPALMRGLLQSQESGGSS